MHPGVGYSPKYKASVWQVIFLAQLGLPRTPATDRACGYLLDNARLPNGLFTADKTARGAIPCLSGNLLRAMRQLGCVDPRLDESNEALAQAVVRDQFRCWCNAKPRVARMCDGLPCAWAAVKALGAFAEVPARQRSPAVQGAVEGGVALLKSAQATCQIRRHVLDSKPFRIIKTAGKPAGAQLRACRYVKRKRWLRKS